MTIVSKFAFVLVLAVGLVTMSTVNWSGLRLGAETSGPVASGDLKTPMPGHGAQLPSGGIGTIAPDSVSGGTRTAPAPSNRSDGQTSPAVKPSPSSPPITGSQDVKVAAPTHRTPTAIVRPNSSVSNRTATQPPSRSTARATVAPTQPASAAAASKRPVTVLPPVVTSVSAPGKLAWAPPALSSPKTIDLVNGAGPLQLSSTTDYVVRLPADHAVVLSHGLWIVGGHNVVVVGGQVDVGGGYSSSGVSVRRGMYLKDQTGTVFVEGVRLSSSSGSLTEGIDLDEPTATVVLENDRVDHLTGSYATNHADGLQTWAGPRKLLIDGLSIDTGYQGMFLLPNQHLSGAPPQLFDLRNVSIVGDSHSAYMIWTDGQLFSWHLQNVDVVPGTHSPADRGSFLWPKDDSALGAVAAGAHAAAVATTAGVDYVSPGYAG